MRAGLCAAALGTLSMTYGTCVADSLQRTRHAVYLEALGAAGLGSVNVEQVVLSGDRWSVGARVGAGTIHLRDHERSFNPDLIAPIGLFGTWGGRLSAEVAAGAAITSMTYPDPETFGVERRTELQAWSSIGCRWTKREGGLLLRIAYTPLLEFGRVRHWGGLSIGFSF